MRNDFSQKDRELFKYLFVCWYCGKNTADALHHIVGRGYKGDDCESSPLNIAPICNYPCHLDNSLNSERKNFLEKTFNYLKYIGYKLTEKDIRFLTKYYKYYETKD